MSETKYYRLTFPDYIGCCKWETGDAINYNPPDDGSYTVEEINETEYNNIIENDVVAFNQKQDILNRLSETDKDMPRGVEDLWDLMITKDIIVESDISVTTKQKLDNKKQLRAQLAAS